MKKKTGAEIKHCCLFTPEEIKQAKRNILKYPKTGKIFADIKKNADWWVEKSDEYIIDLIPAATDKRAMYPNEYGCPIHGGGDEAFSFDLNNPSVIKCKIGGETYPGKEFPDNGNGWRDNRRRTPTFGQDYYFKADVTRFLWERIVFCGLVDLGYVYILTGETKYAHKAAIILNRIAEIYPHLNPCDILKYATVNPRDCFKISNYVWEPGYICTFAEIYNFICQSGELEKLGSKIKDKIKANIFQVASELCIKHKGYANGKGLQFQALAAIWAISHDKKIEKYLIETLENAINNGFSKDGFWMEGATTVYHRGVFSSVIDALEYLRKGGIDLYKNNPKIKKLFDFWVDILCINKFTPSLGDAGGTDAPLLVNARYMQVAYERYGDQKYADYFALAAKEDAVPHDERMRVYFSTGGSMYSGKSNSVSYLFLDFDRILKIAKPIKEKGVVLSETGTGILKGGNNYNKIDLLMQYGTNWTFGSHGHFSTLKIDLFARGHELTPEMGYPEFFGYYKKRIGWTSHTISHCTVMVNRKKQSTPIAGKLDLFKEAPEVKVIVASAEDVYSGIVSLYKRTTALIEISSKDAYVIDIFQIKGGKHHDFIMAGLGEKFKAKGLNFSTQKKGTLAGEKVRFGEFFDDNRLLNVNINELWRCGKWKKDFKGTGYEGSGYQYLYDVKKATPDGQWSTIWSLQDKDDTHLKLTMLKNPGQEVVSAYGNPPIGGYTKSLAKQKRFKYVLVRNNGTNLASTYVSILEPYQGKPIVRNVEKLSVKPSKEPFKRIEAIGLKINTINGTDYIMSSLDETIKRTTNNKIEFKGKYGVISKKKGKLNYMFLVQGEELSQGKYSIRLKQPLFSGMIEKIDYEKTIITTMHTLPISGSLVGETIFISNKLRNINHRISDVCKCDNRYCLKLSDEAEFPIAKGIISSIGKINNVINTKTVIQKAKKQSEKEGNYFKGTRLVNGNKKPISKVLAVEPSGKIFISERVKLTDFPLDVNGNRTFYIYDFGPGDEFTIPTSAYLKYLQEDRYLLKTTCSLVASISYKRIDMQDVYIYYKDITGKYTKTCVETSNGILTFRIDVNRIKNGQTVIAIN